MTDNMLCTVRRCEGVAIVEAAETKGYEHRYCLNHLWQIEETDTVTLIGDEVDAPVVVDYVPPITISQPIYNEDGFSAGFRTIHPPGIECSFHPVVHQCSCGKMDLGVIDD